MVNDHTYQSATEFAVSVKEGQDKLPTLYSYLLHKLHKRQYKARFIANSSSCTTTEISEPEFYGDLVYKFRKIFAYNDFSTQLRKNHSSTYKDWIQYKCNTTDCMHGS